MHMHNVLVTRQLTRHIRENPYQHNHTMKPAVAHCLWIKRFTIWKFNNNINPMMVFTKVWIKCDYLFEESSTFMDKVICVSERYIVHAYKVKLLITIFLILLFEMALYFPNVERNNSHTTFVLFILFHFFAFNQAYNSFIFLKHCTY